MKKNKSFQLNFKIILQLKNFYFISNGITWKEVFSFFVTSKFLFRKLDEKG